MTLKMMSDDQLKQAIRETNEHIRTAVGMHKTDTIRYLHRLEKELMSRRNANAEKRGTGKR